MIDETATLLGKHDLPYGRELSLKDIEFENGMHLLRLTFRENKRFTLIDLDAARAEDIAAALTAWAASQRAREQS